MATVTIVDPYTRLPVRFDGTEIGHASTRDATRRGADRWTELRAWKLPGDPPGWKYGKYGMSVIYHAEPTTCRNTSGEQSGFPATVSDLPDDAEPCPRCRPAPPEDLADAKDAGELIAVRFEFPRIELTDCRTPAYLVRFAATKRDRVSGQLSVMLGGPARELIAQCMRDEDFAAGAQDPAEIVGEARQYRASGPGAQRRRRDGV